jgi:hypothetical protein
MLIAAVAVVAVVATVAATMPQGRRSDCRRRVRRACVRRHGQGDRRHAHEHGWRRYVATVTSVPGSASVEVSLETFQTQTVNATISANQTTSIDVTLRRNTQAAGGMLTTEAVGVPSDNGKVLTIRLQVLGANNSSTIETLTDANFDLPDCTPTTPDPNTFRSECVRFPNDAQADSAYTVDNPTTPANFTTVPGVTPEADFAAALFLDQSGSVNSTDPTGARLFSAKAFVQTVDAGSGDSVLLAAFADDNETQTALIDEAAFGLMARSPTVPPYFDELETCAARLRAVRRSIARCSRRP